MVLDIFIPHYNEPWEVCEKGFTMLALQRCVDWNDIRVTMVHDGTEPFPRECFEGYPFTVHQVALPENKGIAYVRNWCIDHAEAEFIRMNDSDDMFHDVYSLTNIMNVLHGNEDFDFIWFPVMCELSDGRRFLLDERDPVVLHGDVFRVSFLREKGIRFNEELRWCEDSAFLALVEMEIDHQRIGKISCESPIYSWIEREGSLCNRPEIRYANRRSFFKRHCYVQDEFLKHGHINEYRAMTLRVMGDAYYTLKIFQTDEDRTEFEKEVRDYYINGKHRDDLLKMDRKLFDEVLAAVNREIHEDTKVSREGLLSWLKEMKEGDG